MILEFQKEHLDIENMWEQEYTHVHTTYKLEDMTKMISEIALRKQDTAREEK